MNNLLSGVLLDPSTLPFEVERIPGRDLFVVAKYLSPLDAYLVQGCLCSCGIPAVIADAHHVQADQLIAPALGGVRILVPESHLASAAELLVLLERGELALDDDADVDLPA